MVVCLATPGAFMRLRSISLALSMPEAFRRLRQVTAPMAMSGAAPRSSARGVTLLLTLIYVSRLVCLTLATPKFVLISRLVIRALATLGGIRSTGPEVIIVSAPISLSIFGVAPAWEASEILHLT